MILCDAPVLSFASSLVYLVFSKRVQQRLALYHGVRAIHMPFSSDAEDTFNQAIAILMVI